MSYASKNPNSDFPAPKFRKCRDYKNRKNSVELFRYWKNLGSEKLERCDLRFYRLWPVCDFKLVDPNRKEITEAIISGEVISDKTHPQHLDDPDDYIQWSLDVLSSGEWHVTLNDITAKDPICECWYSAIDLTTMNEDGSPKYPPRVNLKTVLWGAHKNQDFLRWCRSRNMQIPGDNPEQEREEEDMSAVAEMAKQQNELLEKVFDAKLEAAEAKGQASREPPATTVATNAAIETMALGATKSMDMMAEQQRKLSEIKAPNPVEILKVAAEIMRPAPDNSLQLLVTTLQESNKENIRILQESNRQMVELLRPQPSTALVPMKDDFEKFLEYGERMKRAGEIFGWKMAPQNSPTPSEHRESGPGFWESAFKALASDPGVAQGLASAVGGIVTMFVTLLGRGPGNPQPQPQTAPNPAPQQPQPSQDESWKTRWPEGLMWDFWGGSEEKSAFLRHYYTPGGSGYTFAQWFISDGLGAGPVPSAERTYASIRSELGPVVNRETKQVEKFPLFDLIKNFPPLWNKLADQGHPGKPADPNKLFGFLNEFLTFPEWAKQQEEAEQAEADAVKTNAPAA